MQHDIKNLNLLLYKPEHQRELNNQDRATNTDCKNRQYPLNSGTYKPHIPQLHSKEMPVIVSINALPFLSF